jgi:hypothetical protein
MIDAKLQTDKKIELNPPKSCQNPAWNKDLFHTHQPLIKSFEHLEVALYRIFVTAIGFSPLRVRFARLPDIPSNRQGRFRWPPLSSSKSIPLNDGSLTLTGLFFQNVITMHWLS